MVRKHQKLDACRTSSVSIFFWSSDWNLTFPSLSEIALPFSCSSFTCSAAGITSASQKRRRLCLAAQQAKGFPAMSSKRYLSNH